MSLRIHAICPVLNEEPFITALLTTLYPFCSGISILSQYDRNWFGEPVIPDRTAELVLNHPDPEGKIHYIVRRWRDQTAARNSEMLALSSDPTRGIQSQANPIEQVRAFHATPDYFLIVDADEIYDIATIQNILNYLELKRPRGMRVLGYNYLRTWNRRIPPEVVRFQQFGFIRPGVLLQYVRVISWNETRLSKALRMLRLPDISARLYGFIECPPEVGVFHHGCWLGDNNRLEAKFTRAGHRSDTWAINNIRKLEDLRTIFIPTCELPKNIRETVWPSGFLEANQVI